MPSRLRVLVAESDLGSAWTVMGALRLKGVDVIAANDAIHVLNMARKERPDAVLLSARLAGGAKAALVRLRSNVYTTDIPVIAVGDCGDELSRAGAQDCVASAADLDAVHAALERNAFKDLDFTQAPAEVLEDAERMAELQETGLLDTPPEQSFDRLTRLAARLLDVPVALVSLVDRDRQFFKSHAGLVPPLSQQRETRLSHSFCQWVVAGREALVVGDAREHPTLRKNLAVRDLGVVAYAGAPILGRTGQAIGSFCAVDRRAREWGAEDLATLEDLSRITRAYAILEREQRWQATVRARPPGVNLQTSVLVAGHAILGATHILRRHAANPDDTVREDLLRIVEEQADHLLRLSR